MGLKLPPDLEAELLTRGQLGPKANIPDVPTTDAQGESEKAFMDRVIAFAKRNGWLVYHVHYSQRSEAGWPDLVLARDRIVYAELKAATGKLTVEQCKWMAALMRAGGEFHVWRPGDWPLVARALKGDADA